MIVIPVNSAGDRTITVPVDGNIYTFRTYYSQGQDDGWLMDIGDSDGAWLATGIRITPGAPNILKGLGDKFNGEEMTIVVLSGTERDFDGLGNGTYPVWFEVDVENPYDVGDPMIHIDPEDWNWFGRAIVPIHHNETVNRDLPDQHPMLAVTGLITALSEKASTNVATPTSAGLMSAEDKAKLDLLVSMLSEFQGGGE